MNLKKVFKFSHFWVYFFLSGYHRVFIFFTNQETLQHLMLLSVSKFDSDGGSFYNHDFACPVVLRQTADSSRVSWRTLFSLYKGMYGDDGYRWAVMTEHTTTYQAPNWPRVADMCLGGWWEESRRAGGNSSKQGKHTTCTILASQDSNPTPSCCTITAGWTKVRYPLVPFEFCFVF